MKVRAFLFALVLACVALLGASCSRKPARVLIVGNSMIYFNMGQANMLNHLGAGARPSLRVEAQEATVSSRSIKGVWDYLVELKRLPEGKLDVVVVQDTLGSSISKPMEAEYREYARTIDSWARERGARTVLLMEMGGDTLEGNELTDAERLRINAEVAAGLSVDVAPVLQAWRRVRAERPDLDLFDAKRAHPGVPGSYLMACVLYATIFKKDPGSSSFLGEGVIGDGARLTRDTALYMQKVAWDTARGYEYAHIRR